jgi:endonuclease YncB( thermonuclease family)
MLEENDNIFVVKSHGTGKYGRVLGELFHHPEDDYSINQMLIDEGHAVAYFGGSKQEVKDALLEARKLSTEYVEKHIEALD